MNKPKYTITKEVTVGIYENCKYIARIYTDKIIVIIPYIKWVNNTGGYDERKEAIHDQKIIDAVLADLSDECDDSAWHKIGIYLNDSWLEHVAIEYN